VILAGGDGSRLGVDKAGLLFQGEPLLHRQVRLLREMGFTEVIVAIGRRRPLPIPPQVVIVEDRFLGCGPLAGLHAGLSAAQNPRCLVVACDMPFLTPLLVRELLQIEGAPITVCLHRGFIEPFPGVYTKEILPLLEQSLTQGELGVQKFIRSVSHILIPEEWVALLDPAGRSFVNLNTWEALRCALSG